MYGYKIIKDLPELIKAVENYPKSFVFDTETTGLIIDELDIVGLSLWDYKTDPIYVQFNFSATITRTRQSAENKRKKEKYQEEYKHVGGLDFSEALPTLQKLFSGSEVCCHNGKFDYKVAKKFGFSDFTIGDDTQLMCYLLDVNTPNGLKYNAKKYLDETMKELDEIIDLKNPDWCIVDYESLGAYACADALMTGRLRDTLLPKLEEFKLIDTYRKLELPIVKYVANMEYKGVRIDVDYLKQLSVSMHKELEMRRSDIYLSCGCEFNIGSNKQLAEVLFDRLKYPVISLTDSGQRSVDEATLKELSFRGCEVADLIIEYNKLDKLLNTYVDKIPELLWSDGRLHGNFNQMGARTGRFSSSEPNLQNQPKNDQYPIRRGFIPAEGKVFIVVDWSTIEIRIMAHESQDKILTELLKNGADLHQETADRISMQVGIKLTRQQGKTINFAILYGMGAESLAYTLNSEIKKKVRLGEITIEEYNRQRLTPQQCELIIQGYYKSYYGFTAWSNGEVERVKRANCYVRTLGGRLRQVNELRSRDNYGSGVRKVVNTKIQGGAGDLMKLGIARLGEIFEKNGKADLLMVVHDEYVIEADKSEAKEVLKIVQDTMINIFPQCSVPIECDGGIFNSWFKVDKIKQDNLISNKYIKAKLLWQKN